MELLMQAGASTPCAPSFPAAATTETPAATALLTAVVKLGMAVSQFGCVVEIGLVPKLILMTLAPFDVAQSIPAITPESDPLPWESRTWST
jgi:hypothetical protein